MNNKQFLIEGITKDIVAYLIDDYNMDLQTALRRLYNSDTYLKLLDERSGLYLQSSAYVYDFLKHELQEGKIK
nr:hypothetical protein [Parabacteroides goldsteinii]